MGKEEVLYYSGGGSGGGGEGEMVTIERREVTEGWMVMGMVVRDKLQCRRKGK